PKEPPMNIGRRVFRGVIQAGFIAGSVAALASCSTVTYGTGTGTTAQTVMDVTRMLNIFSRPDGIVYEARTGLVAPDTNALPPPAEAAETPVSPPPTQTVAATQSACNIGPGQTTPPPGYCTPDPNVPTAPQEGIRGLANPCQWWTLSWANMGPSEREQWSKLGWDESNWAAANTELWPASAGKLWGDLRIRDRRAAEALGFSQLTWDACYLV
ncbi:MAG: hypothetical protein ACTSWI_06000, partial [Alphaproteobacteria bacterium]